MIKYGGVGLVVLNPQTDADVILSVNDFLELDNSHHLQQPYYTGLSPEWAVPEFGPTRVVKLGRLYWPRMASKFAVGHFLATETQLDLIRDLAYTSDSRGEIPLDLVIDDGVNSITASMYMLPNYPLFQWDGPPTAQNGNPDTSANLYLLTLVDKRYWWWSKSAHITVGNSWETLFSDIGTALGESISVDAVSSAYLDPAQDLVSKYEFLPPMLDAVAASVGHRILCKLDGTVVSQSFSECVEAYRTLRNGGMIDNYLAGGDLRFDYTQPTHTDLASLVPETVRVVFPIHQTTETKDPEDPCQLEARCGAEPYTVDVSVQSLTSDSFPWYTNIIPKRGTKTFQSTAIAWYFRQSLRNGSELNALAQQLARDWYGWMAFGDTFRLVPGIIQWEGEAANDYAEWEAYPSMRTKIVREGLNDLSQWVFQESTRPPTDHSSGDPPGSSGAPFTVSWLIYKTECEAGFNHRYIQVHTLDFTTNSLDTGDWIFESVQGCCNCWPFTSSSGPVGSSGPPNNNECVTGTSGGIPWQIQKNLIVQFTEDGQVVKQRTVTYGDQSVQTGWAGGLGDDYYPCPGDDPDLILSQFTVRVAPDGTGLILTVKSSLANWTTIVPMPAFGEAFSLCGLVDPNGIFPADYFCGNDGSEIYEICVIGASCTMPPPPDECIPGVAGVIPWLLPPEMDLQLWRRPLGADPAILEFRMPIRNTDQSDRWERIGAEVHPCDGVQPNLTGDFSADIANDGSGIDLRIELSDGGDPIAEFVGSVLMPPYGGEIYTDPLAAATPATLPANTLCENDATDTYFFRLVAVPCAEQPTACPGPGDWEGYTGNLCGTMSIVCDQFEPATYEFAPESTTLNYSDDPVIAWGQSDRTYHSFGLGVGISCVEGFFNAFVTWKGGAYMLPLTPVNMGDITAPSGSVLYQADEIDFGGGDVLTNVTVAFTWGVCP